MIAITDHGPSMIGSACKIHFAVGKRAPKDHKGMKILWGCEANILNAKGDIDLDEQLIKKLDFILVGIHKKTPFKNLGKTKNTKALINCFKKYPIHAFAHPTTFYFEYDLKKVCQAACDNNILLELNSASLNRLDTNHPKENLERLKTMANIAKKNNKKLIVNSDAHFLNEIGDDKLLKKYMKLLNITKKDIINNYPKELDKFIEEKNKLN
jgi:putative hydrolase